MATREYNFISGIETSELPTPTDPSEDGDLVTKGYADATYLYGKEPVADITALKAVAAADRADGQVILVKSTNTVYAFDDASAATGDDLDVIEPTSGTGRWLKIDAGASTAADLAYVNTSSELAATDVQAAIDEVEARLDTEEGALVLHEADTSTHGVAGDIVGTSDAQTLSAKRFSDAITLAELSSTPTTPSTGDKLLYPKNDGKLYTLDDAGIETEVGSGGGGSGGINYVEKPDAESDVSGWTATANCSVTRTTIGAIRGEASILLGATTSATTSDYIEYQFTPDVADLNKVLSLSFEHADGPSYSAGDFEVVIVKDPGGTEVEIVPAVTAIPATGSPTFVNTIQQLWVCGTADTYALRFKVATETTQIDMFLDNVQVGPQLHMIGVPEQGWTAYTPVTQGFGTITNNSLEYSLKGDTMFIRGGFTAGTPTASEAQIGLPSGKTVGGTSTQSQNVGTIRYDVSSNMTNLHDALATKGDAFLNVARFNTGAGLSQLNPIAGNGFVASGTRISITATIPIAELAGVSVHLSQARVEYASNSSTTDDDDTTSFSYSVAGSLVPSITPSATTSQRNKRVRFLHSIQSTDHIVLKIREHGGVGPWITIGETQNYCTEHRQSTTRYGITWRRVSGSDTDIDVSFARGGRLSSGASFAATGASYPDTAGDLWRVEKYPGVIQSAMPNAIKWQRKVLSADVSTNDADITELGFYNLVLGRTYKYTGSIRVTKGTSTVAPIIYLKAGSTNLVLFTNYLNTSDVSAVNIPVTYIYTAVETSLFIRTGDLSGAKIEGGALASAGSSWAELEELPYHVQTTEWT